MLDILEGDQVGSHGISKRVMLKSIG